MDKFILSSIIFILTIVCVFIKPLKKKEWVYTLFFAIITILLSLVNFKEVTYLLGNTWNAALSLISIMIISLVLDEIGFFKWAALTMVLTAEGSKVKLFLNLIILGTLISMLFNNDGAILILTPIVYECVKSIGFSYKETIPFLFVCGYIADTASVPLLVSNIANIVNADTLGISFNEYFSKMFIPGIAIIITIGITLYIYYKKDITGKYTTVNVLNPDDSVTDWIVFNSGIFILFLVVVGYFVGTIYGVPVSIISTIGAIILLIHAKKRDAINLKQVLGKAPWGILIFAISMYIVVFSLYSNGFDNIMVYILDLIKDKSILLITVIYGIISSITGCIMNNLPSVMVGALAIDNSSLHISAKEAVSFANVIGSDVGAKITPIGSLATIMWLNILSKRGIKISFREYIKTSIKVISPALIIGLLVLALVL